MVLVVSLQLARTLFGVLDFPGASSAWNVFLCVSAVFLSVSYYGSVYQKMTVCVGQHA